MSHTVPNVKRLFFRHRLEWLAKSLGTYSEEIFQEFYASYVENLLVSLDRRVKLAKQDPLITLLVGRFREDISPVTIYRFMYGTSTGITQAPLTLMFDYMWYMVKSGQF